MVSEYDRRKLKIMRSTIDEFQSDKISIQNFIGTQDGLVEALQDANSEWKQIYRSHVNDIEIVFAISLDQNQGSLSEKDRELIGTSVERMIEMLESAN